LKIKRKKIVDPPALSAYSLFVMKKSSTVLTIRFQDGGRHFLTSILENDFQSSIYSTNAVEATPEKIFNAKKVIEERGWKVSLATVEVVDAITDWKTLKGA